MKRCTLVLALIAASGCEWGYPRHPHSVDRTVYRLAAAVSADNVPQDFCGLAKDPRFAGLYRGPDAYGCHQPWVIEGEEFVMRKFSFNSAMVGEQLIGPWYYDGIEFASLHRPYTCRIGLKAGEVTCMGGGRFDRDPCKPPDCR